MAGTGTIYARGLLSDVDLVFDAAHGANQTITLQEQPGRNIDLHLDMSGDSGRVGDLAAGYHRDGSLRIEDGVTVKSYRGYIGQVTDSSGTATVAGADSAWIMERELSVGGSGSGTLHIADGGAVSNTFGNIGDGLGSTGGVEVDAATWTNSDELCVGRSGTGELEIRGGGTVSNTAGHIGYESESTGTVAVHGTGSMWANSGDLVVGRLGEGTLSIADGGSVTVTGKTFVAAEAGSTGTIDFGAGGGTLTTRSLYADSASLTGSGTIITRGLVSDIDLLFDAAHGAHRIFTWDQEDGQDITIHLDASGDSGSVGDLGVGYRGTSSLSIREGVEVTFQNGHIGHAAGAIGTVTIDGPGSTWTSNEELCVGREGSGTIEITGGGILNSTIGYLGRLAGSTGTVTVDGVGSAWDASEKIQVGFRGDSGTVRITGGGTVSAPEAIIGFESGSTGLVTVEGTGSSWTSNSKLVVGCAGNGTLDISGGGTVFADCSSIVGEYPTATGAVCVDGDGSTWTVSGILYVGFAGNATLDVTGGGNGFRQQRQDWTPARRR